MSRKSKGFTEVATKDPFYHENYYDDYYYASEEDKKWEQEWKASQGTRSQFLRDSSAIPTPLNAYALFIELFTRQGGKIILWNHDFKWSEHDPNIKDKAHPDDPYNYESIHSSQWVPVLSGGQIPVNYGSAKLDLLIFPDVNGQSLLTTNDDRRKGWEWGHTIVNIITFKDGELVAHSNQDSGINTYKDVEALRNKLGLDGLIKSLLPAGSNSLGNLTKRFLSDGIARTSKRF